MEKEDLERELEKAEKGCVITVINQSTLPLHLEHSRHPHGKFRVKPPKTLISRETASFSLEGRKSIEASVRFKWGKGRLELFWNMPEQGDPKIFYKIGPTLKEKLFVYIPSAVFGKITKFIFLIDEKPPTPHTSSQDLSSNTNTDTNDDFSSENISDGEPDLARNNSTGEIPIPIMPKIVFDPTALKTDSNKEAKDTASEFPKKIQTEHNSYGFSSDSDEGEEPAKKINIVIKPKTDAAPLDALVSPVVGLPPALGGAPRTRRNTKTTNSALFPDINEQLFQINVPPLTPTTPSPPTEAPVRERRLSLSGDFDRNKFATNPIITSLPLDGLFPQFTPPPHLNTPPLNPTVSPLTANPLAGVLQPSTSPAPITRVAKGNSFDLGTISFDNLHAHGSSPAPLTPKPSSSGDLSSLVPRAPMPQSSASPLVPTPAVPKSPVMSHSSPGVQIPNKSPAINPPKPLVGSPPNTQLLPTTATPPSTRPAIHPPMSPPLQRQPSGRSVPNSGTPFGAEIPTPHLVRRYSEPPPVDLNLLFPEIASAKDKNKKPDVLEPAKKYIHAAILHLENNSIPAALGNLDLCISLLGTLPEETAHELEYCMRYRLFFVLLKEINKIKPPMEHAFLSFFLADISVKPYHRIVAIRMAIRHNMTSSNYGIAAGLIQLLIDRVHPVDENVLQEKLRKCMSQGRSNSDLRLKKYTCPGCETTSSISSSKCGTCQQPVLLCALTLEIITTKAFYMCKLCKISFSRKAISPRDSELKCPFCKVGDLANRIFNNGK